MMQFDVLFSKDNALTSVRALFFSEKIKKYRSLPNIGK
jgi:hypothetical protein